MKPYFEKMNPIGSPLTEKQIESAKESFGSIKEVELALDHAQKAIEGQGVPTEKINARGQLSVWQRIEYLVDKDSFLPMHSVFDPEDNKSGSTSIVDGLARINGRWVVLAGFNNKLMAGAWVAGQPANVLRSTELAKRLNIPLIWLVNCSGVDLPNQDKVYPDRLGGGATFFRNAELQKLGVPVLAAIFGTNPAGGGYHSISPSLLIAHKDANMAVGGGGIVGGMSPKGAFDEAGCLSLIDTTRKFKAAPPGSATVHHDVTGFFRHVFDSEQLVLETLKDYVGGLPAYEPRFFRVAAPTAPRFSPDEIDNIIPYNQKRTYQIEEVVARLVDSSEHLEYRPDYGPEIYAALVKVDGFATGIIANRQGFMPPGYPEYADYPGIGGKLYRQGLIKMSEFVTFCGRDRIPIVWLQDTSGIDVGDTAEKAELLGLGQSLIYSIEQTDLPQMLVVLRKGSAAAHYVMCGPPANNNNAFTLGIPTTEIYVMHGETAAAASYARRLVKDQDAGKPLDGTIEKMNELVKKYYDRSRPLYCAKHGMIDELVSMSGMRDYMVAFVGSAYQNPKSFCPQHQMILPRVIKG